MNRDLPPVNLDSDDGPREMTEFEHRLLTLLQAIVDELSQMRANMVNKP